MYTIHVYSMYTYVYDMCVWPEPDILALPAVCNIAAEKPHHHYGLTMDLIDNSISSLVL